MQLLVDLKNNLNDKIEILAFPSNEFYNEYEDFDKIK